MTHMSVCMGLNIVQVGMVGLWMSASWKLALLLAKREGTKNLTFWVGIFPQRVNAVQNYTDSHLGFQKHNGTFHQNYVHYTMDIWIQIQYQIWKKRKCKSQHKYIPLFQRPFFLYKFRPHLWPIHHSIKRRTSRVDLRPSRYEVLHLKLVKNNELKTVGQFEHYEWGWGLKRFMSVFCKKWTRTSLMRTG